MNIRQKYQSVMGLLIGEFDADSFLTTPHVPEQWKQSSALLGGATKTPKQKKADQ